MDRTDKDRAAPASIELIRAERVRQITQEGYAPEHDDHHEDGALMAAAWFYLGDLANPWPASLGAPPGWPWAVEDWKPTRGDEVRQLVKIGALVAAEIDRRLRATLAASLPPA